MSMDGNKGTVIRYVKECFQQRQSIRRIGRIVHGCVPAAKTTFTLVSVYPPCSMVPGVFGCPIGDARSRLGDLSK
jgi:hypothetical protein